ncbi:phage tail protein [Haematospirillum jordaniae]|uniref:Oxidoreductase n=1 Tax=Haematospirillum jordaniae TaxID=1549855 RepID=A0A143DG80_9PROT|nr:phage tail protein [Haematospirillum jordaniae]AMW35735.1 hypothetical protein AY555_10170 [Haematospirillum jordaniae]NKD60143.1 phage tail protein [Haematospirillum jordaniae]NKD68068.1 phage tail protein [Haematospirillum jordaniae]NKD82241.1 phage tail protein [Haematospirillum jordaniae]NKD86537.1 phage tail protein [Haematospirillum jordaniae]
MLLSLGLFTFSIQTAPFESIKRSTQQRWEEKARIGYTPALQWTGPGSETVTIDGTLARGVSGGPETLDRLREMAATGKAWLLTAGTGENLGPWVIDSVEEGRSHILKNGAPQKVSFSLKLRRYPDDITQLGRLMDSRP